MFALRTLQLWLLALLLAVSTVVVCARENAPFNQIPAVRLAALPSEARTTLALIQRGGPFPYPRDGIEFQNRELRLPKQIRGYYHEYTVPTPGATDRGARRIIAGVHQDFFYTENHYRSFLRILP
jgi:ribonuclease T1